MLSMKKNRATITYIDIIVFFAIIPFFKPVLLPKYFQLFVKLSAVGISLLYVITHVEFRGVFNMSTILTLPIILSGMINFTTDNLSQANMMNGILYALVLYCLYSVYQYCHNVGCQRNALIATYRILKILNIVSIISMPIRGFSSNSFFFGSKFPTSYLLILFLAFYYVREEKNILSDLISRIRFFLLWLAIFLIIWLIGCRTASVALFVFLALSFSSLKIRNFLRCPICLIAMLLLSAILAFVMSSILQNEWAQNLLFLLGKSPNMSDRLRYYERIGMVLSSGSLFCGYGYNSDYLEQMITLGSNLQNGVIQYLAEYGVCGIIALFTFTINTLKKNKNGEWGFFIFLYTMAITAIVEVSISYAFFTGLFALRWLSNDDNKDAYLEEN